MLPTCRVACLFGTSHVGRILLVELVFCSGDVYPKALARAA